MVSVEGEDAVVPVRLRRFVLDDWFEEELLPGPGVENVEGPEDLWVWRSVRARRRFEAAQAAWARAHGYDPTARHGKKPGRDWWAFLTRCREKA